MSDDSAFVMCVMLSAMTTTDRRRTGGRCARRLAALATLLATAATVSACTGHDDTKPAAAPSGGSTTAAPLAPLKVRSGVTRIVGELSPKARKHLATRAGALVEAYFRAAFLAPHAGRAAGRATFPGFTPEARSLAAQDRGVLTGASYAGAERISPKGGTAYVNVLAPRGHVEGATVQVRLALSVTSNGRARPVAVAGRLLLTPTSKGLRIFGYDLSRSGRHARSTP
ncbi:MAG: hypothetical protein QOK15_1612 [Nocardioidaceae bacterium]|nr:hypothetical protein [Nocardioidaceae bacterium]